MQLIFFTDICSSCCMARFSVTLSSEMLTYSTNPSCDAEK